MRVQNNIVFTANMQFNSVSDSLEYINHWKHIPEQFNAAAQNQQDDITLDVLELGKQDKKYLLIAKNSDEFPSGNFIAYIKPAIYEKLMQLNINEIVEKFKKMINCTNQDSEFLQNCAEFIKKHHLEGDALKTFNLAVEQQLQQNIQKSFADDEILNGIEFHHDLY